MFYTAEEVAASTCRCGRQCIVWSNPPVANVCDECCTDHDWVYSRWDRDHECQRCGILRRYTDYDDRE